MFPVRRRTYFGGRSMRACFVVLVASSSLVAVTFGADAPKNKPVSRPRVTSLPSLPTDVQTALQDRRFAEAIKLVDAQLSRPSAKDADYLLYLKGRAQTELKLYDQAVATFRRLVSEHPKSDWVSRARFGEADVAVRQRNYQAAGEIYGPEARRLLSVGRRDELTAIYVEFADRYFEGFADVEHPGTKKHDYAAALEFYTKAVALQPGLAKRQQIDLRIARCHDELKHPGEAITAYQRFLA